jgi:hypothetical protein
MKSRMRLAGITVCLPVLALACANGTDLSGIVPEGADSGPSVNDQSPGEDSGSPYVTYDAGARDSSQPVHDSAAADTSITKPDSAQSPIDSAVPDTSQPPTGGDCIGTQSTLLSIPYDQACDNYFLNPFNAGPNPCRVGGNDCAALNGGGFTFCCFKPRSGSYCDQDYNGVPQCLPK